MTYTTYDGCVATLRLLGFTPEPGCSRWLSQSGVARIQDGPGAGDTFYIEIDETDAWRDYAREKLNEC